MLKQDTYTVKTTDLYRRIKPLRKLHDAIWEVVSNRRRSVTFTYAGRRWQIVEVE